MPFEYAPAPESRAIVDIAPSYGLFIDGEFVDPSTGARSRRSTRPPRRCSAEVAEAGAADVDRAVRAARRAYSRVWSRMSGRERAKYLFRIARLVQERSRELAVLETLDNGKPIRESRDVDIPLVAAHFFYYAGLGRQARARRARHRPAPARRGRRQVIPWNFPLLMLAWKIAPALACGNTVVLKPAETTPLTALLFAEICQQAELPPGVVNIVTGAGATGARPGRAPRRRQGGVHRLDRGRQGRSQRAVAGTGQAADPGAGRQGRQHRLRRRAAGPGGRGDRRTGSSSTRATCAARAPGCWCRSRSRTSS